MLRLGTAKTDITPRSPIPLAGFSFRSGAFERITDPLFARIFYFQSSDGPPVILVSADLIWWGNERIEPIQEKIRAVAGNAVILLHATHSHSGPQTTKLFSPLIGEAAPAYLQWLERSLLEGVREAMGTVEPVTVERGAALCDIGIHRRRLTNGVIQMAPNPDGPNDPECAVIRFRTQDGTTKAVLIHFTCHPTTTAENAISAEFCGVATHAIETAMGGNVTAAYLQGCCGDIRPALICDGEFYRGGPEDVRRLGAELAGVILRILDTPLQACEPEAVSSLESELPLYFETPPDALPASLKVTKVQLGRDLGFLTFNAEMVVEYGLFVKQQSGNAILPVAYTNGMIGYVTTARQLDEGGYESREAFPYFGMPGPFARSTEGRIQDFIKAALKPR